MCSREATICSQPNQDTQSSLIPVNALRKIVILCEQMIINIAFVKYLRKRGNTRRQLIVLLWTAGQPMIQLGGKGGGLV